MATWDVTLVTMVRVLINDLGTTETYTDERIKQSVVVGGLLSSKDYDYSTDYTFDLEAITISPDPVAAADTTATALFALRAACILDTNAYQGAVTTGIKVRDGDSEVDTTGGFKGYADILRMGPCNAYSTMMNRLSSLASMNAGKAVMSPLTHEDSMTYVSAFTVRRFYDDFMSWR